MTYEPNPSPSEAEPFAPTGGQPLDGKAFAPLTASLLARKGEAEPALEPISQARMAPGAARQMQPGARHEIDKPARGAAEDDGGAEPAKRNGRAGKRTEAPQPASSGQPPQARQPVKSRQPVEARPQQKVADAPRMNSGRAPQPAPEQAQAAEAPTDCPRKADKPKRAAVTFRMSTHDFLRLKLASAELEVSGQDIIIAAIEKFLDERGVERLDECLCLQKTARACSDKVESL